MNSTAFDGAASARPSWPDLLGPALLAWPCGPGQTQRPIHSQSHSLRHSWHIHGTSSRYRFGTHASTCMFRPNPRPIQDQSGTRHTQPACTESDFSRYQSIENAIDSRVYLGIAWIARRSKPLTSTLVYPWLRSSSTQSGQNRRALSLLSTRRSTPNSDFPCDELHNSHERTWLPMKKPAHFGAG